MPSARDLRKKIRSVTNTKKITRTMELVATSKAKRAQDRVRATRPYSETLNELLHNLARAGTVRHPLFEKPQDAPRRSAVFVVTANRGLCGGYNTNTLHAAERLRARELAQGREVDLYVIGRKGLTRMRFLGIEVTQGYLNIEDRPTFREASELGDLVIGRFLAGEVDRVLIVSTRYISTGTQRAEVTSLLPIEAPAAEAGDAREVEFIFEPDPQTILESLLPLSVKNLLYRLLVEAAASEQVARRMAMKRATDSAEEMIESYTRLYNRSRQAGITQQINEIVSGASALE